MKEKKFKLSMPHPLVLFIILICVAGILTYIIPAGAYDTIEINGREVYDVNSFHYVDQNPATLWGLITSIPNGLISRANLIFMVMCISGSIGVINSTKALDAAISKVAYRLKNKLFIVVPALLLCFSVIGHMGLSSPVIAFVPLGLLVANSLGVDALVGVSFALVGVHNGFACAAFGASSTATAQSIIGLPVFSGWQVRILCSLGFTALSSVFLIRYCKRVQNDPTVSIMYQDGGFTAINESEVEKLELTPRRIGVLIVFFVGLCIVLYGAVNGMGMYDDVPAVFLCTAVICGLIYGYTPNKIAEVFVEELKGMLLGCLFIGFAAGISSTLTDGNVIDTIVHALACLVDGLPSALSAVAMFLANTFINFFIISASGQASVVIPIFSPVGDLVNISQQTVVLAFNFGDGLSNVLYPTNGTLLACLALAGVSFTQWLKFFWKWFLGLTILGCVMIFIAASVAIGPF